MMLENISAERAQENAIHKFKLKILRSVEDKCPVRYIIETSDRAITIKFLEETKTMKTTAGGRGSRARRRKRREQKHMEYQQRQESGMNERTDSVYIEDDISLIYSEDQQPENTPRPPLHDPLAFPMMAVGKQHSSATWQQHSLRQKQVGTARPEDLGLVEQNKNNSNFINPQLQRSACCNNEEHLFGLLEDQMKEVKSEIENLRKEQIYMMKNNEKMETSIKRIRIQKERETFCWVCGLYTPAIHYCLAKGGWIHLDRYNKLVLYGDTEAAVYPKDACDKSQSKCLILGFQRGEIDDRINIQEEREKMKKAQEEEAKMAAETEELSNLMLKVFGDHENLQICDTLNTHIESDIKSQESQMCWKEVDKFLGVRDSLNKFRYNKLSTKQKDEFNRLRNNGRVRYLYNELAKQRNKELEQKREEEQEEEQRQKIMMENLREEEQRQKIMMMSLRMEEHMRQNGETFYY